MNHRQRKERQQMSELTSYLNPMAAPAAWFQDLWNCLPLSLRGLFYMSLGLVVIGSIYKILGR